MTLENEQGSLLERGLSAYLAGIAAAMYHIFRLCARGISHAM